MTQCEKFLYPLRLQMRYLILGLLLASVSLSSQQVMLGWDPSSEASITSYNIYRTTHPDSTFTLLATVLHPDSTYFDETLEWDTHYFYVSTSIDIDGVESSFSNVIDTTLLSTVPVELYAFSARITNSKQILLDWSTMAESNNYGFEIQRLCDGNSGEFETIGFVSGNGTDVTPRHYHFTDEDVPEGTLYYRLKQIDFDGSYKLSATVEITLILPAEAHLLQNYPNPFNSSTEITYNLPENSHVELFVYDINGQEVTQLAHQDQIKGKYKVTWDATDLFGNDVGSGTYYYKIKTESFTEFRKMTLLR